MKNNLYKKLIAIPMLVALMMVMTVPVFAAPPVKASPFICPTVSLSNPNGTWVLGDHGAYYVLVPTKGKQLDDMGMPLKVFVTVPLRTLEQAQIPAGKSLYKEYPSYPNFESQDMSLIMLLEEGLEWVPTAPANWGEGDMLKIVNNEDGTYTVINMGNMMDMPMEHKGEITIDSPIPLNSAVFW